MTLHLLSRRRFLKLAALSGLALAGCRTSPGATPSSGSSLATTRPPDIELTLRAQEVEWELAPGKAIRAWTYNDTVPGETIRVREGDRVRVTLQNDLPEPTTIHWHGIDVPANMDGVPDISQPAIQPGETFVYEFDAVPAGTRWYHTHVNSERQMDLGLAAAFIIDPATPETGFDREYTLLLDDWVTGSGPVADSGGAGSDGMMGGGVMGGMDGMMGDPGPAYDTFTINGKAFPATEPIRVNQGERVRLRLINASNMQTFRLRLDGHRWRVTHTDGNALAAPVEVDVLPIAPAERYDVIVAADNPGKWPLAALDTVHLAGGLRVSFIYDGYEDAPEAELSTTDAGLTTWVYLLAEGVDTLPTANGKTQLLDLTLSGGMMGSNQWTINGQVYPNTEALNASLNQLVRVGLFNMSMQAHPFHLHGQSFRVVSLDSQALSKPLIKDTVDVPIMGTAEIEFVAFNPGDWLFHCHKPMHMDGGMAMVVKVG